MPDRMNRSPCPPGAALSARLSTRRLLQESAPASAPPDTLLREVAKPDRAHVTLRREARGADTVTLIDVTVAVADRVNRNGRIYPKATWQAAIDAAQEDLKAGKLWGLLEHADDWDDPLLGELECIVVRYESLTLDGDTVKASAVLIRTQKGNDLEALLTGGIAVGVSSSGYGSTKYFPASELLPDYPDPSAYIGVVQDDFRLLTIDFVSDPSDVAGSARRKERRERAQKENRMHPLIKQLCERLGKTLEQVKKEHATEYYGVLETIAEQNAQAGAAPNAPAPVTAPAAQPNAPPAQEHRQPAAPAAPQPASQVEGTLEREVLSLTTELRTERTERVRTARRNIAIAALESAQLPRAPKVGEVDLDARFREQLEAAAIAAQSDDEARSLVDQMISERRALMGATTPSKPGARQFEHLNREGRGGVTLPTGNTSGADPRLQEGYEPLRNIAAELGLL